MAERITRPNHPAFKGFGRYLLPRDNGIGDYEQPLNQVGSLMPYHSHVDPNVVVAAINYMIDQVNAGDTIFYDFYTEAQKREDPAKAPTGLFFFRGRPGAPFAIVCPGGGFFYVGSLHEGFPLAMVLSQKGYNTFVLRYRTGGESRATEDLSAAISYVFKNAGRLEIDVANYSLWGGSAGARMAGNIAMHGTAGLGGENIPKPRIVVIAYTGHAIFSKNFPPTFITVSEDDGIVHVPTVDRRVENMRNEGIEVEYRKYKNAGHGFGLGVGTDAEGWIKAAIRFWEGHS
jgi:acetyl esterase/lipase